MREMEIELGTTASETDASNLLGGHIWGKVGQLRE
jgi:hypothetical protein